MSMKKELSVIGIAMSVLLLAITTSSVTAQNATTNASNAMNKTDEAVNATAQNATTNASNAMNKTGEAVNATANEAAKNASDTGSSLLNKTVDLGKKIVGGVATVLGNATGEIKEGIGAK